MLRNLHLRGEKRAAEPQMLVCCGAPQTKTVINILLCKQIYNLSTLELYRVWYNLFRYVNVSVSRLLS